jgi:hypothetical protein
MATRTIVTSQPDVACEVCGRRLLRGEQPNVFLVGGRRRIVCELCAPRAAHEGWLRETESQSVSLPSTRPRRGRSLFERLPVPFRARQAGPAVDAGAAPAASAPDELQQEPYDLLGGSTHAHAEPLLAGPSQAEWAEQAPPQHAQHGLGTTAADPADSAPYDAETPVALASQPDTVLERASSYVEQAIAVFNASEFPRRVAGVTRSLGAPAVTVRSAEHLSSVVSIVVAWELCWYRYEVDLSEPAAEALVIGQGTELGELAREDRRANAAVGESGTLALAAV